MLNRFGPFFTALGFIIGLLSLILQVTLDDTGTRAAFLALGLLLILVTSTLVWFLRSPPWRIISARYVLTIEDDEGKAAVLEKKVILKSYQAGNQRYTHRNLNADGDLEVTVPQGLRIVEKRKHGGEYTVELELPQPVGFLETAEHTIKIDYVDSFPTEKEALFVEVDEPVNCLEVEIQFPGSRPPASPTVVFRASGKAVALDPPNAEKDRLILSLGHKMLPLRRGRYEVWWSWPRLDTIETHTS